MGSTLAVCFVDEKLPPGALLVTVQNLDLLPLVGKRLGLSMEVPNHPQGQHFISPTGLSSGEHLWPIEVHERDGKGYFIIGGDLIRQTELRPYLGRLYREGEAAPIAPPINWPMRAQFKKYAATTAPRELPHIDGDPIRPQTASEPEPPPLSSQAAEAAARFPDGDTSGAAEEAAEPAEAAPAAEVTEAAEPFVAADAAPVTTETDTRRHGHDRPEPWPIRWLTRVAAPLLVVAASTIALWWFWPPRAGVPTPLARQERNIRWTLGGDSGEIDVASELGQQGASCHGLRVARRPAFGSAGSSGTRMSYTRSAQNSLGAARADALEYEIGCGNTQWSGTIGIEQRGNVVPPVDLGDIEIRVKPFRSSPLAITDLRLANAPAADWIWDQLPQGASLVSVEGADKKHVEILLHSSTRERVAFALKDDAGRSARGRLVVIPIAD